MGYFVSGKIIVVFKHGVSHEEIKSAIEEAKLKIIHNNELCFSEEGCVVTLSVPNGTECHYIGYFYNLNIVNKVYLDDKENDIPGW